MSRPNYDCSQSPLPRVPTRVPSITATPATAVVTSMTAAHVIVAVTSMPEPATRQPVPTLQHGRHGHSHLTSILSTTFAWRIAASTPWPHLVAAPFLPPSLTLLLLVQLKLLVVPQSHQANRNSPGFLATSPLAELRKVVFVIEKEGRGWGWEWELKPGRSRGKRCKRGMGSRSDWEVG